MLKRFLFVILASVVEVSYLYPIYYLAVFAAQIQQASIISLTTVYVITIGVTIINYALAQKSLRIITIVVINLGLFFVVHSYLVKVFFFPEHPLLHLTPWISLVSIKLTAQTVFFLLLILLLWIRALMISRRKPGYSLTVNRFELSMSLLFLSLLAVELLAVPFPQVYLSFLSCILGNIGCLSLASSKGEDMPWLGIIFPSLGVLLVFALLNYAKPFLGITSRIIYSLIKPVAVFLKDIFAAIIIFLATKGKLVPQGSVHVQQNSSKSVPGKLEVVESGGGLFGQILAWTLMGIVLLAIGVIVFTVLKKIFAKLFAFQEKQSPDPSIAWWLLLLKMIKVLIKRALIFFSLVGRFLVPQRFTPAKAYGALLSWGKYKNHPREEFETPSEYYGRLSKSFPGYEQQLRRITQCYLQARYGYQDLPSDVLLELKSLVIQLYLPIFKKVNKLI